MSDTQMDDNAHVFIVGSARSGTTLLSSIIHLSDAYAVYRAETKLLDECRSRYGSLAGTNAWKAFTRDWFISRQFYRSGLSEAEFVAAVSGSRASYTGVLGSFMAAVAHKQGRQCWVEDTPSSAFRLPEIAHAFPRAKVIHIVRDGRAVAASLARLGWTGVRSSSYRKGLCYAALKWQQSVQAVRRTRHCLGDRFLEIGFEDLVTGPEAVTARLSEYLGVDVTYRGDDTQKLYESNTAFGDVVSSISPAPASRWKEQLSDGDIRLLNCYIGTTLGRYGYPVECSSGPGPAAVVLKSFRTAMLDGKRMIKQHTLLGRMTPTPLELNEK